MCRSCRDQVESQGHRGENCQSQCWRALWQWLTHCPASGHSPYGQSLYRLFLPPLTTNLRNPLYSAPHVGIHSAGYFIYHMYISGIFLFPVIDLYIYTFIALLGTNQHTPSSNLGQPQLNGQW